MPSPPTSAPLSELRQKAYDVASNGALTNGARMSKQTWFARSEQVRQYVLARAKGTCEACGVQAPFKRRDGTPYLEPHHTTRLADEEIDHPATLGVICPTVIVASIPGRMVRSGMSACSNAYLRKNKKRSRRCSKPWAKSDERATKDDTRWVAESVAELTG